jgi:hypothetical protein
MTDSSDDPPRVTTPSLAEDTLADKAVRFGCGAVLGVAVMAYILMNVAGSMGLAFVALVFVFVCGALAVAWGEAFFEKMLRLIQWL